MDPLENSSCWWKLPADIQADILNRLPGDSLVGLKLVSWGWYNVISYMCMLRLVPPSPEAAFCGFIFRDRLIEGVGPPSRLRLAPLRRGSNFEVPYQTIKDRLWQEYQPEDLQDCCNGILLLVHHDNDGGVRYSVNNLSTGESIQVPPPPQGYHNHHTRTSHCCFASLAFEPTKSFHFKIVCTPGVSISNPLKVETFWSETGKWLSHVVKIDSVIDGAEWIHRSAYLDGHIYRLLKSNYLVRIDEGKCSELLRMQTIELPKFGDDNIYTDDNNHYGSIGISRRRLHYSTRDRNGSTLLVYMLNDDFSWHLKHTVPIDDLLANPSTYFVARLKRIVNEYRKEGWFNFYDFHPNSDNLFLITPCEMLFYQPEEKSVALWHSQGGERELVVGPNYSFRYLHCPIILRSAFRSTSWANCGSK